MPTLKTHLFSFHFSSSNRIGLKNIEAISLAISTALISIGFFSKHEVISLPQIRRIRGIVSKTFLERSMWTRLSALRKKASLMELMRLPLRFTSTTLRGIDSSVSILSISLWLKSIRCSLGQAHAAYGNSTILLRLKLTTFKSLQLRMESGTFESRFSSKLTVLSWVSLVNRSSSKDYI